MRLSLVFSSLLCVATWMTRVDASIGPVIKCDCPRLTQKRINPDKIVDYTVQFKELCSIKAIVLQTVGKKRICGAPGSDWVRKAMGKVDKTKTRERKRRERREQRGRKRTGVTKPIE